MPKKLKTPRLTLTQSLACGLLCLSLSTFSFAHENGEDHDHDVDTDLLCGLFPLLCLPEEDGERCPTFPNCGDDNANGTSDDIGDDEGN